METETQNDKEFECSICRKAFSMKFYLKKHELLHKEGKFFNSHICDVCNKSFRNEGSLKSHKKLLMNLRNIDVIYVRKTLQHWDL